MSSNITLLQLLNCSHANWPAFFSSAHLVIDGICQYIVHLIVVVHGTHIYRLLCANAPWSANQLAQRKHNWNGMALLNVVYCIECNTVVPFPRIASSNIVSLTHWGRVMHICIGNLTIIGLDNELSPGWHQATIWTNAGILSIGPLGTNFNEILIEIYAFSFKKYIWKYRLENVSHFVSDSLC